MSLRSYPEAINFLYSRLPVFHRVGPAALKPGLEGILALCAWLGNPHKKFRAVHIAGTNGKGSSSHLLASILQEAGYKTGLYTSPHLKDFRERIRINGRMISEQVVVDFVNHFADNYADTPSFFELTTALAFQYFADNQVDIAVIETGLGGRLDSTNVISPTACLITNIGMDHAALLGPDLPTIAAEKAGIIKSGVPVVISQRQPEVEDVFIRKARLTGSPIQFASDHLTVRQLSTTPLGGYYTYSIRQDDMDLQTVSCPLGGIYQQANLAGVWATAQLLKEQGFENIDEQATIEGIANVIHNTGLKGRWQMLQSHPTIIADVAHNLEGLTQVFAQASSACKGKLHVVLGIVADKDITGLADILPAGARYYITAPSGLRAKPAAELAAFMELHLGYEVPAFSGVNEGLEAMKAAMGKEDFGLVTGSSFLIADIENL